MGVECVSGSRIGTFERGREQEMLVFLTVWKRVNSTLSSAGLSPGVVEACTWP